MKLRAAILFSAFFALFAVNGVRATPFVNPGTNYMIISIYDSFDSDTLGNGVWCWKEVGYCLMYPQHVGRFRFASQSGQNNNGFVKANMPQVALPLAGSMHGTNEVYFQLGCSGNGGQQSNPNYMFTNITWELQFPMTVWTRDGRVTNDWPWATNLLFYAVYGDSVYLGPQSANSELVRLYSDAGSNAAANFFVPYIDSFSHTSFETNVYATNAALATNLYFAVVPLYAHPQRRAHQGSRFIDDYRQEGMETNVWNWTQDWQSSTVSSTNHCVVSGVTRIASSFTATIQLDRNGPVVEIPDATHTNDIREAFTLNPVTTNAINETMTFTNLPAGTFVGYLDGVPCFTNASVLGTISINWWHIYKGAWHDQGMAVLDGIRVLRDVSPVDASTDTGQAFMSKFGSESSSGFPTNQGTASYTAVMQPFENLMEVKDLAINALAQQTNHTFSIQLITPRFAPFHR